MRCFSLISILPALLLAGCAGYAADYWKPKNKLISDQLARYGLAGEQGRCAEQGLTQALTVWQLRQLSDLASRLTAGGTNPAAFSPGDFIYVAGLVENPKVGTETQRVFAACGIGRAAPIETAAALPTEAAAEPTPSASQPATAAAPPLWVNLGAAQTGQGIAVDAATVTRGPNWRQAWFRLLNTDQSAVGDIGYLLRIDCAARIITAHAGRKYAPGGALLEQRNYPTPEGPMSIETGTVIEVAYHALCDDPR